MLHITFDNKDTLGVTSSHPIFSTTHNDWRFAGELEIGEKVLTFDGEAAVTSVATDTTLQEVYNLEVKDLHNFLVGDLGVVVHNTCKNFWSRKVKFSDGDAFAIDHIWDRHSFNNRKSGKTYFSNSMTKQKIKDLVNEILNDPFID